ncbi:baseplate assembly protein [Chromobacterium haemolyticum]|uniref:baseplate assembly protein n=1 Tax=Chromobacterium haemolyticum TaxID=394935 RepID=UPI0017468A06|nr:baseplate J/gp47 family protein [Chromobacterium haemolyticum]QOD81899.1 baseplate J/gp47 family protein [Chromobacterium haemolyticum]
MATPEFIARAPDQITQEMVADLEGRAGKTLYPAQPERLLIDFMAYRESLLREQVQDAALLNLVRYSRGAILDELAKDRGEDRLPAYAAGCTLEFRIPVAQKADFVIPAGTVVSTGNGALSVATIQNVTLPAGQFAVTVKASATDAGAQGNGYIAGQINQLISILAGAPGGLTVSNTTTTDGGAEEETDERLQLRLLLSFDRYSVAGPAPAYRLLAMRQHPSVIDVAVFSHTPGEVTLYPLLDTGLPGQTVIDAVQAGTSADTVRVLCDTVVTAAPVAHDYSVSAVLTLNPGDVADTVLPSATAAVQALANSMAASLGGDIVPSQFTGVLQPLVHRVELQGLGFAACDKWEWRRCTGINLTIAG